MPREICGVPVRVHRTGDSVIVRIADEEIAADEVARLRVPPTDCTGWVEIGPYRFDAAALAELQAFAAQPDQATPPHGDR